MPIPSSLLFKDAFVDDVSVSKGIVTHYWSAFDNMDLHWDIIEKGAYAKTIRERGPQGTNQIKFLWMHWTEKVIGMPILMEEDDFGLLVVTKIFPDVYGGLGRDVLTLYNEGALNEHSVGIDVVERSDEDRRIIKVARLWEGSVVTWGANPKTPVVDMKTKDGVVQGTIETPLEKQIQIARRSLEHGISDRLGREIESWLKLVEDPSEKGPASPPQEGPENDVLKGVLRDLDLMSASLELFSIKNRF